MDLTMDLTYGFNIDASCDGYTHYAISSQYAPVHK